MSKIRFKTRDGQIHEYDDVQISTQAFDVNGKEIWEGDRILSPAIVSGRKKRHYLVYSRVDFTPPGDGRTVGGHIINNPVKFTACNLIEPECRYSFMWSQFFRCEVENDENKAEQKIKEANGKAKLTRYSQ